ncbi:hypothetical protein LBMAG42_09750 [Deltaproteobacteria bacterium]|nr:hypothetical protein LBMAG42_09750 [Deltaproteobacteria bacterium]
MLLLLLAAACTTETPDASAPTFTDADGATLMLTDGDTLVWTQADRTSHPLSFFVVEAGAYDPDGCSYDPYWLYNEREAAGTLASADVNADLGEACNGNLSFRPSTVVTWNNDHFDVAFEGNRSARLDVDVTGPGLRLTVIPEEEAGPLPYLGVTVGTTETEAFYGLGETFDSILHRGRVRPMQIEVEIDRESAYNEVHVPVPLLVSSANWGMLVDSFRPGVFDVAATRPDAVTAMFQQEGGFSVDLYAPPTAPEVTGRYWERTGAPEVPPDWAFAPLQWRNEVASADVVLDDARTIRELALPTGVLWVDNPWQSSYNSMVPDPEQFPDWPGMMDELHALGFRMLAWTTPYVEDTDPEHATYEANSWLIQGPLLFNNFGDIVDFTNPDATAAWAGRVAAAKDLGIEGWKLDYGEDVQLGLFGSRIQPTWAFDDGSDERTMHHQYAAFYHTPYVTPYREDGMLLGRGGCLGGQTITDVIWPGDLDNGFERWNDVDGEDGILVGGLTSAIHGGTGLSVSGYPFYASDTGGYRGGRPTKESFIRWMEYAATLPIWQYGGAGENHNAWDFTAYGESQFDQATLDAFRTYAVLHTRLWPYYQAAVSRMMTKGIPVVLPQGLGDPEGDVHDEANFFVGEALFVGPVVDEGEDTWTGTLPTGEWVHWWSGERFDGGQSLTIDAPLGAGPLFQRAGSVVPLLRRTIQTLSPATSEGVESWVEDPGALNARIVPGAGAIATVADGASIGAESAAAVLLEAGSAYSGWDVEIYAPGAAGVSVDGTGLAQGVEGCESCFILDEPWVRVVLPAGGWSVAVE